MLRHLSGTDHGDPLLQRYLGSDLMFELSDRNVYSDYNLPRYRIQPAADDVGLKDEPDSNLKRVLVLIRLARNSRPWQGVDIETTRTPVM